LKKVTLLSFCVLLFLSACEYRSPVTTIHRIPIDPAILGPWVIVPQENEDDSTELRILEFSDTEYSIHYSEGSGDLYFRAYAFEAGGVSAVQLELIGSDKESIRGNDDYPERFQVASYKMVGGLLEVRTLNSDLIKSKSSDSDTLRSEFVKYKDHPELFNDPGSFKRKGG